MPDTSNFRSGENRGETHTVYMYKRRGNNVSAPETELINAHAEIGRLRACLEEKQDLVNSLKESIAEFNAVAFNEYKTALQKIYLRLEFILLNHAGILDNIGKAEMRKMQGMLQKMNLMNEDLIYLSQLSSLNNTSCRVDLNQVLRIVRKQQEEKTGEAGLSIDAQELPMINGSALLMIAMFTHFIQHTLSSSKFSGKPSLIISSCIAEAGEQGNPLSKAAYRICFADNVTVLNEKSKEYLFDIVCCLHNSGKTRHNIHLPAAKKIMKLHNGAIVAECRDEGFACCVFFPVEMFNAGETEANDGPPV